MVLAAQTLQVIDFLFGVEACGGHIRCFCLTPWCDCVIYGPPVARNSDLYDDTELTVPVLVMAQCAARLTEEHFHPAIQREALQKCPRGDKRGNLIAVGLGPMCFDFSQTDIFIFHSDFLLPQIERYTEAVHICIRMNHVWGRAVKYRTMSIHLTDG